MRIAEIYECIQGELPNMGVVITMCRLQGCPEPHCKYCDSGYALDPKGGEEISTDSLIARLTASNFVTFSGGEPLLQEKELGIIINLLDGKITEVETSGYFPPPKWWSDVSYWVVDYKVPSSGRESIEIKKWKKILGGQDAVKFVVSDNNDLSFAIENRVKNCKNIVSPAISKNGIVENGGCIYISPTQLDWIRKVERFCVENNFLFSLQQQKLTWGLKKGV